MVEFELDYELPGWQRYFGVYVRCNEIKTQGVEEPIVPDEEAISSLHGAMGQEHSLGLAILARWHYSDGMGTVDDRRGIVEGNHSPDSKRGDLNAQMAPP